MECTHRINLVSGNLLSSAPPASLAVLADVLDSLLLCQVMADQTFSKFEQFKQWSHEYDTAMVHAQWNLVDHQGEGFELADDAMVKVGDWVEDKFLIRLPSAAAVEVRRALAGIVDSTLNPAANGLFRRQVLSVAAARRGSLPVTTVVLQLGWLARNVQLHSLLLKFSTSVVLESDLCSQTLRGLDIVGEVDVRYQKRSWNAQGYAKARSGFLKHLEGRREAAILPVVCASPTPLPTPNTKPKLLANG